MVLTSYNPTKSQYEVIVDKPICVLIDEAQFLTKEQVWQLTDIVDELECNVITYGLRSDFKGEPFEGSIYLMTLSDDKMHMHIL